MTKVKIASLIVIATVLVLTSCNLPNTQNGNGTTLSNVMIRANVPVEYRTGPGVNYPVIGMLNPGQEVEAVGINPIGDYLLISDPANPATRWWIKNEFITFVNGNSSGLQVWYPPNPLNGNCPTPVDGLATPVNCDTPAIVGDCPTPVNGGSTPVDCATPVVTDGCPTPVGGGETPVNCDTPVTVEGCPTPVGGGATAVNCDAPVTVDGCPTPVGGGPTPIYCGAPILVDACPTPVGGGPAPLDCGKSGGAAPPSGGSGCPTQVGGGPPVNCNPKNNGSGITVGVPTPVDGSNDSPGRGGDSSGPSPVP